MFMLSGVMHYKDYDIKAYMTKFCLYHLNWCKLNYLTKMKSLKYPINRNFFFEYT